MQRKMQFVTNELAAILQNIARQKTITKSDLYNAIHLAYLSYFPGMTHYPTDSHYHSMPLGYMPMTNIFYFVGTAPNTVELKWRYRIYSSGKSFVTSVNQGISTDTILRNLSGECSSIHPKLRVSNKGEAIILLECFLFNDYLINISATGKSTAELSKRELFGFLIYEPVGTDVSYIRDFFPGVTVFSPQSGFSEKAPS